MGVRRGRFDREPFVFSTELLSLRARHLLLQGPMPANWVMDIARQFNPWLRQMEYSTDDIVGYLTDVLWNAVSLGNQHPLRQCTQCNTEFI